MYLSLAKKAEQCKWIILDTDTSRDRGMGMVLILDGNSEHVAHAREKKIQICDCSRSTQMPSTDQIKDIDPYVRTYF